MVSETMGDVAMYEGVTGSQKDHVCVAVRFRPLSDKERNRGDREVWGPLGSNTVGILEDVGVKVKYAYDYVFDGGISNTTVYKTIGSRIVKSSLDGINGTVFAYGVTSSGKTHTMMGTDDTPGMIPLALTEVFRLVERSPKKEFLIRMSMMEIYNEVLNDLLNPSKTNLKLREDPRRGFYVEGITEETLLSCDHALSVIAAGDAHRKVSATAFNEGSSRSHTIIRLSIEASDRPEATTDPNAPVARTLSFLHLIDLAGSESAKVEVNKSQRVEGSYINKSLLTLGTVIHKLSDGNAQHIPFRDSKLTRLLQNSLTGQGAKMAVVCTLTPASTQAEETHNTLKFASRAKKIEISAKRNEIIDQSSLIARYQQEVALLRGQLEIVMRERGGYSAVDPHMHPEMRTLRERLEEERQALIAREAEKARLEERIRRLTQFLLNSAAADTLQERRLSEAALQKAAEQAYELLRSGDAAAAMADFRLAQRGGQALGDAQHAVRSVRGAGELMASAAAAQAAERRSDAEVEAVESDLLRVQLATLALELAEREKMLASLRTTAGVDFVGGDFEHDDVAMQVMYAEREFMQAQLQSADDHSERLAVALERLRRQLATERGVDPEAVPLGLEDDWEAQLEELGGSEGAAAAVDELRRPGYDPALADKVLAMEDKVQLALDALRGRDEQIATQRKVLKTLTGLEEQVQGQLAEVTVENTNLRRELERLEVQNNHLQGYNLDYMPNEGLSDLIGSLTSAVERVRITVQLRRLAHTKRGSGGAGGLLPEKSDKGMSREAMRAALDRLQAVSSSAAV
ncbi:hypothetical protein N2152v2_010596 [Parachlorella kessleri]